MTSEADEKRTRILGDLQRETGRFQTILTGLHNDVIAVRSGAPSVDLDLSGLLTAMYAKIDLLRTVQRTICNHHLSLTGKRVLPPQVRPPSPVFRF